MHPFDFNLLCCLVYAKPNLPRELLELIFMNCIDIRKCYRKNEQNRPFSGSSRNAIKRRARKYQRCRFCGNYEHNGPCSKNQTFSQAEYVHLINVGPIRFHTEKLARNNSYVKARLKSEIMFIKEKVGHIPKPSLN